jgi:hypothetical protein
MTTDRLEPESAVPAVEPTILQYVVSPFLPRRAGVPHRLWFIATADGKTPGPNTALELNETCQRDRLPSGRPSIMYYVIVIRGGM